jgi:tRNA(adenine34) deaminase
VQTGPREISPTFYKIDIYIFGTPYLLFCPLSAVFSVYGVGLIFSGRASHALTSSDKSGYIYNKLFNYALIIIMKSSKDDEQYMRIAISAAQIAAENGDVPIGAVIVYKNQIIGKAYNQREQLKDPTAHAEIIAMTQAASYIESWRLHDCTIYVTLEPCPMCAGALVLGRMDRLIYGCDDPKTGACKSLYNIVQDERLNHRLEVTGGVLAEECSKLLQEFFQRRRIENNQQ